jgi:hypothetical protein
MKITENLILEQLDMEKILAPFLKSYKFYSKGKEPEKIILPKITKIELQTQAIPPIIVTIPVEYIEEELPDDASRPLRTKRTYKVA